MSTNKNRLPLTDLQYNITGEYFSIVFKQSSWPIVIYFIFINFLILK